jgi:hypothetical protein
MAKPLVALLCWKTLSMTSYRHTNSWLRYDRCRLHPATWPALPQVAGRASAAGLQSLHQRDQAKTLRTRWESVPATSPRPHPSDLTDEQWALIEPIVAAPGRVAADDGHEPGVRVGGDQLDPGQTAGGQVAEELQPAGAVLAGGDLQAEDLAGCGTPPRACPARPWELFSPDSIGRTMAPALALR